MPKTDSRTAGGLGNWESFWRETLICLGIIGMIRGIKGCRLREKRYR